MRKYENLQLLLLRLCENSLFSDVWSYSGKESGLLILARLTKLCHSLLVFYDCIWGAPQLRLALLGM